MVKVRLGNFHLKSEAAYSLTNKQNEPSAHEQTERTNTYFAHLMCLLHLLYSANSQMLVPFVIFHFSTLSYQLIDRTAD